MTTVAVPVASAVAVRTPRRRAVQLLRDYLSLCKPRIMSLLLLTEGTTMVVAARGLPPVAVLCAALAGGALASGGASAINCWYDRDIDASMQRTCARPLPAGRIRPLHAIVFGSVLIAAAAALFTLAVNPLSAVLAAGGAAFYVAVYTMILKRNTPLNIVIGGAAGAFPPLVGWAAVQGDIAWPAVVLFAIIFLWTPPHVWSLALLLRRDYDRVGVPMLPGLVGAARTHRRILLYVVVLIAASLVPALVLPVPYAGAAAALGAVYLVLALVAQRRPGRRSSALLFHFSLLYLALLFVAAAAAAA